MPGQSAWVENMKRASDYDSGIRARWKYPVLDGITEMSAFESVYPKVLWVLKEPNKSRPRETWNHRGFHQDITVYSGWRRTYQKLIYTSYGIIRCIYCYSQLPDIDRETSMIDNTNVLRYVAVTNINKNGGTSQSNQSVIRREYIANRDFLLRQIDSIAPDIIINASRVWEIFLDLAYGKYLSLRKANLQYSMSPQRLVVNYYHPNSRVPDEEYCNCLLRTVRKWRNHQGNH